MSVKCQITFQIFDIRKSRKKNRERKQEGKNTSPPFTPHSDKPERLRIHIHYKKCITVGFGAIVGFNAVNVEAL